MELNNYMQTKLLKIGIALFFGGLGLKHRLYTDTFFAF